MNQDVQFLAERLLQKGYEDLPPREQHILKRMAKRLVISENINETFRERLTIGERLADRVASFGGSWTFIIIFITILTAWIFLNSMLLAPRDVFDPYPYIFLNLILSMLAALQAPVIMMSQNRQAYKDRMAAAHDYEVNLKAELEIMDLHEKLDKIRKEQLTEILRQQAEQLRHIEQILKKM